jgi:hypothetical protein
MGINSDHIIGFLLGLGGAALGHHFYKKNKATVDAFLKEITPRTPLEEPAPAEAFTSLSMEELMLMKERLEDMIAEREATEEEPTKETEKKPAKRGAAKTKK